MATTEEPIGITRTPKHGSAELARLWCHERVETRFQRRELFRILR